MEKGRREEIAGWKLIGRILKSLGAAARLGGRRGVLRSCCLALLAASCWFVLLSLSPPPSLGYPCLGPARKLDKIFATTRLKSFLSGRSKLFTAVTEFKRNRISETDFFVSKIAAKPVHR